MWEGVTYVEPSHRPVIHEGTAPVHAVVMNAGPATIALHVWRERTSDRESEPTFTMIMPPGNTRSVGGGMIAVGISGSELVRARGSASENGKHGAFAAVAWRTVP